MGGLPPVFIEFLGKSTGVKTAMRDVKAELGATAAEGETSFGQFGRLGTAAIAGIGIAAAGAAVGAVKMAADFQTQMTRVRTGAGETAANMKMVSDGVLAMAGQVGQSTTQLTSGLYLVESAGYHGADALNVLKTAAMGAKVGAADLGTTSDALTTAMNAYKMSAGQSTQAMNALIATEGQGKTTLEDLASSMANILPTSAAAHVGLNEVLGAMATMTAQGTPAAVAATYLRQTIGMLSNPSSKAAAEMKDLGLSSVQVSQNLGKNGLASTLTELTDAIQKHMGPAGTVLIQHLQAAAKNTTAYQKVLANLPPAQQTYIGALATMVGGTKSMQAALELTGAHMADFKNNTATIAAHVKAGGNSVEGWAEVQKTFNQRMAEAKAGVQSLVIQVGNALLPVVTRLMGVVAQATTWLTKHKQVAEALAIVIGGALVVALAALTAGLYEAAVAAATNPLTWIVLGVMVLIAAIVMLIMHWRQVWGAIKSIAESVGKAVAAAWGWVAKETSRLWHDITSSVSGAWTAVASFFSSAWHAVADPIVAAWHWVENLTSTVWNAIAGFFKRWWPLLLVIFAAPIAIVMSVWNHFHKQIEHVATTVWNAVAGFFKAIWSGISAAASWVWDQIMHYIVDPMLLVWHYLQDLWNTVSGWLASAWHAIASVAGTIWTRIMGGIVNPIESAWHTVTRIIGNIATAIWSGLKGAWNAVSSIGSWFLSIGSDIVNGIISGIEQAGSALFSTLGNLAKDALNAAKSFLGINSPSRVFADHVGMAIPEGIAKGVNDHAQLAHAAVGALAGGLSARTVSLGTAYAGASGYGTLGSNGAPGVAEITTIVQIDGAELFRAVQPHALRNDRRNPQAGLVFVR